MKKLIQAEVLEHLKKLNDWKLDASKEKIEKQFVFADFTEAVCFLNRVAEAAEEADHHPDLHLTDYKKLKVVLSTHSAEGLTRADFKLALKIQEIADEIQ